MNSHTNPLTRVATCRHCTHKHAAQLLMALYIHIIIRVQNSRRSAVLISFGSDGNPAWSWGCHCNSASSDIMPCCQIVYLFQFPVVRIKRTELCPSYSLSMVGGHIYCLCVKNSPQSSRAVWKSRWTSWAPVPNKPTVPVDVKQLFNNNSNSNNNKNSPFREPVWPSGKALGW